MLKFHKVLGASLVLNLRWTITKNAYSSGNIPQCGSLALKNCFQVTAICSVYKSNDG